MSSGNRFLKNDPFALFVLIYMLFFERQIKAFFYRKCFKPKICMTVKAVPKRRAQKNANFIPQLRDRFCGVTQQSSDNVGTSLPFGRILFSLSGDRQIQNLGLTSRKGKP